MFASVAIIDRSRSGKDDNRFRSGNDEFAQRLSDSVKTIHSSVRASVVPSYLCMVFRTCLAVQIFALVYPFA